MEQEGDVAHSSTDSKLTTMTWNDGDASLDIPHDPRNNVATFRLAPGFTDFQAFAQEAGLDDNDSTPLSDIPMVTDDEYSIASEDHPDAGQEEPWNSDWHSKLLKEEATMASEGEPVPEGANPLPFDLTPEDKLTSEQLLHTDEEE